MMQTPLPWPISAERPPMDAAVEDDSIAAEWLRTGRLAAAGIVTATAIALAIDPPGTAAIVVDMFRWWLL